MSRTEALVAARKARAVAMRAAVMALRTGAVRGAPWGAIEQAERAALTPTPTPTPETP